MDLAPILAAGDSDAGDRPRTAASQGERRPRRLAYHRRHWRPPGDGPVSRDGSRHSPTPVSPPKRPTQTANSSRARPSGWSARPAIAAETTRSSATSGSPTKTATACSSRPGCWKPAPASPPPRARHTLPGVAPVRVRACSHQRRRVVGRLPGRGQRLADVFAQHRSRHDASVAVKSAKSDLDGCRTSPSIQYPTVSLYALPQQRRRTP